MPRSRASPRHRHLLMLLAAARHEAGLSQVEMATRLSRPQSWVSKVEAGERRLDIIELIEVCEILGQDPVRIVRALVRLER